MSSLVQVVLDFPQRWADGAYTYSVPPEWTELLQAGSVVLAPFGNRELRGVVTELDVRPPEDATRVKPLLALLRAEPLWRDELRELSDFLTRTYACTRAEAFTATLPSVVVKRVLDPPKRARKSRATVGLGEDGARRPELTTEQAAAVAAVAEARARGGTLLLEGVTGSGKTEVYLHAVEQTLAAGRSAIVLVPEVSLTPQAIDRYRGRLGDGVALLHSALGAPERAQQWLRLYRGEARVALGTRSAVFAPLTDVGLIVLDEEHDASYKQDSAPRYHARQVAAWRVARATARGKEAALLLGSATPCLESYNYARSGRYGHPRLTGRAGAGSLPQVEVIDLRQHRPALGSDLSRPLLLALQETLERGEQSVLLFNRRGWSRFLQCSDCGEVPQCRDCSISLTVHASPRRLLCHYCGWAYPVPNRCPSCDGTRLSPQGSGTERLEQELAARLPTARLLRMDRDTTARQGSHAELLRRFAAGEADVLLGTQMVAKGLDFPRVTTVGVIGSDQSLHLPDFRAAERCLQLLVQVSGRSGRAERPGRVFLQAWDADHPLFDYARRHDYVGFLGPELKERQEHGYPPFVRLGRLLATAPRPEQAEESLVAFRNWFAAHPLAGSGVVCLPATACPVEKIKGMHRWHLLLKARSLKDLSEILRNAMTDVKRSSAVRWAVDVDPQSLL